MIGSVLDYIYPVVEYVSPAQAPVVEDNTQAPAVAPAPEVVLAPEMTEHAAPTTRPAILEYGAPITEPPIVEYVTAAPIVEYAEPVVTPMPGYVTPRPRKIVECAAPVVIPLTRHVTPIAAPSVEYAAPVTAVVDGISPAPEVMPTPEVTESIAPATRAPIVEYAASVTASPRLEYNTVAPIVERAAPLGRPLPGYVTPRAEPILEYEAPSVMHLTGGFIMPRPAPIPECAAPVMKPCVAPTAPVVVPGKKVPVLVEYVAPAAPVAEYVPPAPIVEYMAAAPAVAKVYPAATSMITPRLTAASPMVVKEQPITIKRKKGCC